MVKYRNPRTWWDLRDFLKTSYCKEETISLFGLRWWRHEHEQMGLITICTLRQIRSNRNAKAIAEELLDSGGKTTKIKTGCYHEFLPTQFWRFENIMFRLGPCVSVGLGAHSRLQCCIATDSTHDARNEYRLLPFFMLCDWTGRQQFIGEKFVGDNSIISEGRQFILNNPWYAVLSA